MKRSLSLVVLVGLLAALLAACGGAPASPAATTAPTEPTAAPAATTAPEPTAAGAEPTAAAPSGSGERLVIVSSLPRTGSSKGQTDTVVNAIKQRLEEDNYQACDAKYTIEYQDLDDATAAAGQWTAEAEAANANKAVEDADVMVYIGTFNSGAAKVSIPILNEANLVMISPANTYPGLTKPGKGEPNEPDVYYPNGTRNYARVVPADDLQGAAAANWAKSLGATSVYILDDAQLYGKGIADVFNATATEIGLEVLGQESIDGKAADYRALAAKILDLNPDLVYYGGITQNNAGQLLKDLRGEGYEGNFMGPDGIYEQAFIDAAGADIAEGVYVTFGGVPPAQLEGKGAEWYTSYKEKYGSEPEVYAVYGYEAANVALAAINSVCEKDRAAIRDAVFATADFDGVLGTWSFDANGDTSLTTLSGAQITGGSFEFVSTLAAPDSGAAPAPTTAATGSGERLVIVSSLPRTGSSKGQTDTVVNAIKQRLEEDNYQACNAQYTIEYQDLDDATAAAGQWTAEAEAANANRSVEDPDVMVYIGTFNSGAAKVSIPILNEANLVMISPANTYPGLTKPGKGEPNEPDVYYPNGTRNYARVVPADDLQGAAAANWAKSLGATSVYILDDAQLYGKGIADVFNATATEIGLEVLGQESIDGKAADYRALAAKILDLNPDLVYYGGITQNNAGQLLKDLRGEGYEGNFMGPDGIYEQAFIDAAGADIAEGVYVTFGGVPPAQLEGKGAEWYTSYKEKYGSEPEVYAVYGYEAANVALAAINSVCQKDRAAIRDAVFATADFDGVLGTWSFDANGDTSLTTLSGAQIKGGAFEFVSTLAAP
jgi:branched-chain amino acid transport system substrate-binding protein